MYAQYLSENIHFSKSMEDIMEVLQITRQGIIINTFVKFHIYIYVMKENLTTKSVINER
jgi:hypothetical protein